MTRSLPVSLDGTRLSLRPPADYRLWRDVCSYGYFLLSPNHWDVERQSLSTAFALENGPAGCLIRQIEGAGGTGGVLRIGFDRTLTRAEAATARRLLTRMLRLDETEDDLESFHRVDPRWKRSGRGRLFRSASLFEDVVKTVTSCNVAWPSTVNMNRRLCEVCGGKSASGRQAFPTPEKLARTRAGTLRARCRVGYRDQRLIDLAKLFVRGEVDEAWLTDGTTPDEEVFRYLKTLPGIGPYAAGNIMQLLGRYSRLAVDTESVRHGRLVLGLEGDDRAVMKRLEAHYEQFGEHRFRSYWFELWSWYEGKRGPSHLWDREQVGSSFTAAQF